MLYCWLKYGGGVLQTLRSWFEFWNHLLAMTPLNKTLYFIICSPKCLNSFHSLLPPRFSFPCLPQLYVSSFNITKTIDFACFSSDSSIQNTLRLMINMLYNCIYCIRFLTFIIFSENVLDTDNESRKSLLLLRKSPDADRLEAIVSCKEFKELAHKIMDAKEGLTEPWQYVT